MSNSYQVAIEVAGPAAMFTRPDTGSTPISYPVPTFSAAKGMFEAVLRRSHIYVRPACVEVCRPVRFERYVTNYGGPLRNPNDIAGRNSFQFKATILIDVRYRIYAEVISKRSSRGTQRSGLRTRRGRDWRPEFVELFRNRLERGQTFYTPCLGWKEFVPSYFGVFRERDERGEKIEPERSVNLVIPSLLHSMWDHRKLNPTFKQDWQIVNGLMSYDHQTPEVDDAK